MTIFPSFPGWHSARNADTAKNRLPARYPLVESLGGLSFLAVTAGGLFGAYPLWALPVLYVFACVSIVIAFIDLDHHLILNVVLLPTLIGNGVAAGCGIVWHRGVESSWSRSALRADSLRVLFRTLTHLERWHGRRRHQTRVHSRIAAWLAWLAAIHHWIVRRVLHRRCHQLGIAGQQKGRPSWRHPLWAHPCCSAHGLAFSPAYQSPHYTCNSPDLRNASAYKTHIYKERP